LTMINKCMSIYIKSEGNNVPYYSGIVATSPIIMVKQIIKKNYLLLILIAISFTVGFSGARGYFTSDDYNFLGNAINFLSGNCSFWATGAAQMLYIVEAWTWIIGYKLWGTSATSWMFFGAVLFTLIAVYIYKIGNILRNKVSGFFAAVIFISSYHVYSAFWWRTLAVNLGEILVFFLVIIFHLIKYFKEGKKLDLFIGILFTLLSIITFPFILFALPILFIYLIFLGSFTSRWKGMLLTAVLGVVGVVALLLAYRLMPSNIVLKDSRLSFSISQVIKNAGILFSRYSLHYFPLLVVLSYYKIRDRKDILLLPVLFFVFIVVNNPLLATTLSGILVIFLYDTFLKREEKFALSWFLSCSIMSGVLDPTPRRNVFNFIGLALFLGFVIEGWLPFLKEVKQKFAGRKLLNNFNRNLIQSTVLLIIFLAVIYTLTFGGLKSGLSPYKSWSNNTSSRKDTRIYLQKLNAEVIKYENIKEWQGRSGNTFMGNLSRDIALHGLKEMRLVPLQDWGELQKGNVLLIKYPQTLDLVSKMFEIEEHYNVTRGKDSLYVLKTGDRKSTAETIILNPGDKELAGSVVNQTHILSLYSSKCYVSAEVPLSRGRYEVEIIALGRICNGIYTHMVVEHFGKVCADWYLNNKWKGYTLKINSESEMLHKFKIYFDNDAANVEKGEDRNLYVSKIIITVDNRK